MKKIIYTLSLVVIVLFTACKKDKEIEPESLNKELIFPKDSLIKVDTIIHIK